MRPRGRSAGERGVSVWTSHANCSVPWGTGLRKHHRDVGRRDSVGYLQRPPTTGPPLPSLSANGQRAVSASGASSPTGCWSAIPVPGSPPQRLPRRPGGGSWSLRSGEISLATPRVLDSDAAPVTGFIGGPPEVRSAGSAPHLNPSNGGVPPHTPTSASIGYRSAKPLLSLLVATDSCRQWIHGGCWRGVLSPSGASADGL